MPSSPALPSSSPPAAAASASACCLPFDLLDSCPLSVSSPPSLDHSSLTAIQKSLHQFHEHFRSLHSALLHSHSQSASLASSSSFSDSFSSVAAHLDRLVQEFDQTLKPLHQLQANHSASSAPPSDVPIALKCAAEDCDAALICCSTDHHEHGITNMQRKQNQSDAQLCSDQHPHSLECNYPPFNCDLGDGICLDAQCFSVSPALNSLACPLTDCRIELDASPTAFECCQLDSDPIWGSHSHSHFPSLGSPSGAEVQQITSAEDQTQVDHVKQPEQHNQESHMMQSPPFASQFPGSFHSLSASVPAHFQLNYDQPTPPISCCGRPDCNGPASASSTQWSNGGQFAPQSQLQFPVSSLSHQPGLSHSLSAPQPNSHVPTESALAASHLPGAIHTHSKIPAKDVANSCHRCKIRKPLSQLFRCTAPECVKKYCVTCLKKHHNQSLMDPNSPEASAWICPACSDQCTCPACAKKKRLSIQVESLRQQFGLGVQSHSASSTPNSKSLSLHSRSHSVPGSADSEANTPLPLDASGTSSTPNSESASASGAPVTHPHSHSHPHSHAHPHHSHSHLHPYPHIHPHAHTHSHGHPHPHHHGHHHHLISSRSSALPSHIDPSQPLSRPRMRYRPHIHSFPHFHAVHSHSHHAHHHHHIHHAQASRTLAPSSSAGALGDSSVSASVSPAPDSSSSTVHSEVSELIPPLDSLSTNSPPANLPSAVPDRLAGSCHQCKSLRPITDLFECSCRRGLRSDSSSRSLTRDCRKKYCSTCLNNWYKIDLNQLVALKIKDPEFQWKCPSCQGACPCAACRRKKEKEKDKDSANASSRMLAPGASDLDIQVKKEIDLT